MQHLRGTGYFTWKYDKLFHGFELKAMYKTYRVEYSTCVPFLSAGGLELKLLEELSPNEKNFFFDPEMEEDEWDCCFGEPINDTLWCLTDSSGIRVDGTIDPSLSAKARLSFSRIMLNDILVPTMMIEHRQYYASSNGSERRISDTDAPLNNSGGIIISHSWVAKTVFSFLDPYNGCKLPDADGLDVLDELDLLFGDDLLIAAEEKMLNLINKNP